MIFVLLVQIFTPSRDLVYGATFTFNQTDWSGGTDTVSIVNTPNNWLKYYSASSTLSLSGSILLSTSTTNVTSTDDGTTNTGFNLAGSSQSQTQVIGSGQGASISLAVASQTGGNGTDGSLTISSGFNINTQTNGNGGRSCADGVSYNVLTLGTNYATVATTSTLAGCLAAGDVVMLANLQGSAATTTNTGNYEFLTVSAVSGNTVTFTQVKQNTYGSAVNTDIDIGIATTSNAWSAMASAPDTGLGLGASMVYPNSGDYIYVLKGSNTATFWAYSISKNNWTTFDPTDAPGIVEAGGSLVYPGSGDYIYAFQGGGVSSAFWAYSITNNNWTTFDPADPPSSVGAGGGLVYPGTGDYIYALLGASPSFYRYSISQNSWTALATTPNNTGAGAALAYPGNGDYIYATRGSFSLLFWAYSITNNNWTTFDPTDPPTTFGGGAGLVYPGSGNYIFAQKGNNATTTYAYSLTNNNWTTFDPVDLPTAANTGGAMVYVNRLDTIYSLVGNTTANFYKYYKPNTQKVILQRVPQYTSVTVNSGGSLTANPWNGLNGGVLALNANSTVSVASGGSITMSGSGYRGGNASATKPCGNFNGNAYQGESLGRVGVSCTGLANQGGGPGAYYDYGGGLGCYFWGAKSTGGSYATLPATSPGQQVTYGIADLSRMYFGSGAGGSDIKGASGAGMIYINATTITVGGSISANGQDGVGGGTAGNSGGAGGSVYLLGNNLNLGTNLVSASGGVGATGAVDTSFTCPTGIGDAGGEGRIYLKSSSISGSTNPVATTAAMPVTYFSSGTSTSGVIDIGFTPVSWDKFTYASSSQANSAISIKVRTFNNANASDAPAWGICSPITPGADLASGNCVTNGQRYIQYQAVLTNTDNTVTPSLNSVSLGYTYYNSSGTLTSNIYDSGDASTVMGRVEWDEDALPTGSSVLFEFRTANNTSMTGATAWVSPPSCSKSGTVVSCGIVTSTIATQYKDGVDDRYFQYRMTLSSNGSGTASIGAIRFQYVMNAAPNIGNVTAVQNADGTVSISYQVNDIDTDQDTNSVGLVTPYFYYCVNGGSSCTAMTHFTTNATAPQAIPTNFSTTTINAVWVPATDTPGVWDPTAKIKIVVSDLQMANSTSSAFSGSFTLDTKSPTAAAVFVDASTTPATVNLTATDNSGPVQYRLANSSGGLASAVYATFTSQTTFTLPGNPSTVYAQFKDAYSNETDPVLIYATTPETPSNAIVQDISNMRNTPPDYRMFLAWKLVAQPSAGFGSYEIWRSLDNISYTKIGNITDRSVNFYADSTVPASTNVYYKIFTTDSLGNRSFSSAVLQGRADGIQGAGEGGGGTGTGPTITNIATSSVSASSITVTWETDALSNSTVSYSTTPGVFSNSLTVGSMVNDHLHNGPHTVILANLTPDTTYYFSVRSADINGNYTVDNNSTAGYIFHTTPGPTITSGPTPISVLNNAATITWQTSLSANSSIFYSTSSNFAAALNSSDLINYSTDHSLTLSDLSPSTKYYYYVRSMDGSGNVVYDQNVVNGVAEYYNFFTTNDITAPIINNANAAVNTTTAAITWQTDENADSQVYYGPTLAFGSSTPLNSFLTNNHSVSITNLTPNTTYYYQILSRDGNGNLGVSVGNLSFLTGTPVDTTPPVITNVATSSIGLTYATINWTTSKNTNATVDFGPTLSYGNLVGSLYDYSTSTHSVNLTSLLPNTMYYFRVNSADVIGNSASSTGTFTTVPDNTPPVISATTSLANNTAAFVSWKTDELAYSRVNYALDLTTLGTSPITVEVTSTAYTNQTMPLTGLTPSTTYYYNIIAWDLSANTTTVGPYSFDTPVGPQTIVIDNTKPNIIIDNTKYTDTSLPTISNIQITNITPFGATITWLTDKDSSSLIKYGQSVSYGFLAGDEETMTQSHSVPLINLDPGTTYHLKVKSIDKNGNVGVSEDRTFTTLNIDGTVAAPTEQPQQTTEDEKQAALDKLIFERIKKAPIKVILGMLDAVAVNPVLHQLTDEQVVHSFTDLANQIGTAPTIVGLRPQVEVHGNSATVRWSTDKKTTGLVSFAKETEYLAGSDHPYTTSIVDSDALSTVHTVELASLEPATRYHFQVVSKGEIGPEARSKDYTFETEAVLPIVSDAKVTDVKATEATISWKTNVPTASNLEYTNIETKKTLSAGDPALLITHVFTLQSLEPGSKYSLVIKAKNESGQESPSNPLTFETVIDKEAPKVSSVSANSTLYPGANAKVQTIISWDTNEMAESQLFYQEGVAETQNIKSLPIDTGYSSKHFVVLTAFKPGLVYKYWIESTDQSGNKGKSEPFTTLTPTEKQTIIDIISNNFQSVFGWTKNVGL